MKGGWGLLLMLCIAFAAVAEASTLYRCVDGDGMINYVGRRIPGAECRAVPVQRSQASRPAQTADPAASPANADRNPPATFGADPVAGTAAAPVPPAQPSATSTPPASSQTRRVQGQVYSYIKDGVRHYSSRPPATGAGATALRAVAYDLIESCYACAPNPGVSFASVRLNTGAYRDEISAAAARHGVDEAVVRAIIHAESAFNPNAVSRAGAQGLMQLMPATAQRFGVSNAFDPGQNINGGVQYLAWLLRRFNGDLTLASAGYNAGEGAVDRHGGVPPFRETRTYVERVRVLADRYRGQLVTAAHAPGD